LGAGILGLVSEPDLFVVCKNCSSEVSPYVTECPYCGQRVRKRAPKIDRGRSPDEQGRRRRVRPPRLPPLRRDEIPGIAPESKPYATGAFVLLSLVAILAVATGRISLFDAGAVVDPIGNDWWRLVTTPFLYDTSGPFYAFVTLIAIALFGTLLERRFGPVVAVLLFLAAGAGGVFLALELKDLPALGGNGAALGLLTAWIVDDRLSARRGMDRGNDLIGVAVFAAVLLLMPLADTQASVFAGLGGAAVGAVVGAVISPFRP
jgi:membrane associated rhomboid family serine protease